MNQVTRFLIATLLGAAVLSAAEPAAARKAGDYTHGPDSKPQEGVPKGKLLGPLEFRSKVIANTVRQYWIYVPAQYTGDKPACLLVFQDGQQSVNWDGRDDQGARLAPGAYYARLATDQGSIARRFVVVR